MGFTRGREGSILERHCVFLFSRMIVENLSPWCFYMLSAQKIFASQVTLYSLIFSYLEKIYTSVKLSIGKEQVLNSIKNLQLQSIN